MWRTVDWERCLRPSQSAFSSVSGFHVQTANIDQDLRGRLFPRLKLPHRVKTTKTLSWEIPSITNQRQRQKLGTVMIADRIRSFLQSLREILRVTTTFLLLNLNFNLNLNQDTRFIKNLSLRNESKILCKEQTLLPSPPLLLSRSHVIPLFATFLAKTLRRTALASVFPSRSTEGSLS